MSRTDYLSHPRQPAVTEAPFDCFLCYLTEHWCVKHELLGINSMSIRLVYYGNWGFGSKVCCARDFLNTSNLIPMETSCLLVKVFELIVLAPNFVNRCDLASLTLWHQDQCEKFNNDLKTKYLFSVFCWILVDLMSTMMFQMQFSKWVLSCVVFACGIVILFCCALFLVAIKCTKHRYYWSIMINIDP